MRKFLYIIAFILAFASTGKSQNLIAVHHNGSASFYTTIAAAYTASLSGDTIYIPGGVYDVGGFSSISKSLHIYGVGHNPDSSNATVYTYLNGSITFGAGSDNSTIEGCYISSNFYGYCNNFIIRRCKCSYLSLGTSTTTTNYTVINSIIDNFTLNKIQSSGFYNNIIKQVFGDGSGSINNEFQNNIFTDTNSNYFYLNSGGSIYNINNCSFKSNIFLSIHPIINYSSSSPINNIFYNNILVGTYLQNSSSVHPSNLFFNNIYSQPQSTIFVNQSGGTFNYNHNYQLQSACPGKNAGTDGTDVGIYGGTFPWKDGSIPSNPHIQFKSVAPKTTIQNTLPVQIKVKAQDN